MATSRTIGGTFAPVPTPVDFRGAVDLDALGRHLGWLSGAGADGAVILGTNGEFPSFTLDERRRIAAAAASARSGLRLILGIGSCALGEVLTMAEEAERLRYDGVLCPPPFYFRRASVRGLVEFYGRLLEAVRTPLLLYHIPQLTGVAIDEELLDLVDDDERLVGVKDSSGDPSEMKRLLARFAGRSYLVGSDRLVRASRQSGGTGSITAAASVVPALVADAAVDGRAQEHLSRVRGLLEEYGLGPAVKALLRGRGIGSYGSRPPVMGLEHDPNRAAELVRRFEVLMAERPAPG